MPVSRVDTVYRSLMRSKFFNKGWGKPENLKKLFEFRKVVSNRETCYQLVPKDYPVTITKEVESSDSIQIEGQFQTPFNEYLPGLLPKVSETAFFQVLLPKKWESDHYKPVCLHLAGTGDHFFFRRRAFMAKPLLKKAGIGAILLENPFYGARRPEDQRGCYVLNVSDIFVMGGCLILESLVLFHWCRRNGLGPFGVTGLSMGGHMASLAATNLPEPIVLVPCLSWTTASAVFTQGVMSNAINWDLLEHQYFTDELYSKEIKNMVKIIENDACYAAGQHFAKNFPSSLDHVEKLSSTETAESILDKAFASKVEIKPKMNQRSSGLRNYFMTAAKEGKENQSMEIKDSTSNKNEAPKVSDQKPTSKKKELSEQEKYEALQFMYGIMDECTHLSNFSVPVDTELIIAVTATDDGYVPREGLMDIRDVWPGAEVRFVKAGHISAFVLHQKVFRTAIIDAFGRLKNKYYQDETTRSQSS